MTHEHRLHFQLKAGLDPEEQQEALGRIRKLPGVKDLALAGGDDPRIGVVTESPQDASWLHSCIAINPNISAATLEPETPGH